MSDLIDNILNASFFSKLWEILVDVVIAIVNVILWPFSLLIKNLLPDLDAGMMQVAAYFDIVDNYMGWVLNAMAVPSVVLTMAVGYYSFVIIGTSGAWVAKLVLKWKQAIF